MKQQTLRLSVLCASLLLGLTGCGSSADTSNGLAVTTNQSSETTVITNATTTQNSEITTSENISTTTEDNTSNNSSDTTTQNSESSTSSTTQENQSTTTTDTSTTTNESTTTTESTDSNTSSDAGTSSTSTETNASLDYSDNDFVATDWTDETHSKSVDPNYDEVFDKSQVKRLDFVVSSERWQSMLDDMTANYGTFGQSSQPRRAVDDNLIDTDEDPIFVPADVYYKGKQWYRVGIRFKGNSSLQSAWQAGILKLSFKMDFDEFEDQYPQIDNQRFYGFKKFSLKNNYDDKSFLRESVASDLFRAAGVPVSHTSFYQLYIDHGNGPEYFGLYTLVEEVDGEVLDTQFESDDGNLYKPEDGSANFVEGTFSSEDFTKKTNEDEEDWSDIEALFLALHDSSRTSDPSTWRSNLEALFDVDGFIKYLAVNTMMQNWDTYGLMPHNYYLYNNPENGKLTWIPWDNNEALQDGKQGGALALDFSNLASSSWPLIAKIYADDTYKAKYDSYLSEFKTNIFNANNMYTTYDSYEALIEPYATSEVSGYSFLNNSSEFATAISELKTHVSSRESAVESYLGE